MTVHHHLDDLTLMRYARGELDTAFSVVVSAHLSYCAQCRAAVRAGEEIGGHYLDMAPAADMVPGGFERVLHRIDAATAHGEVEAAAGVPSSTEGDVPLPLRRYIGAHLSAVKWRMLAPGVRKYDIKSVRHDGSKLYMLHIGPGLAMPEHGHGGAEITLVLSGAYRDDIGRFGAGDVADLDADVEHQPRVEGDEPCICIVAAEAPTRFKGAIARLLQPWTGI